MAHVGTPMDLAKQPATTGSNGFWRALFTLIVVVAIAAAMALGAAFIAGPKPAADNSYNQIEDIRGAAPLFATPDDRSYNAVEGVRGGATGSGASVGTDQLDGRRGTRTLSGPSIDQAVDEGKGLHGELP